MQTVSATYERLRVSTDKWHESRLVIDNVGTFGEDKLFSISTSLEMFHGSPAVGSAVAGEIEVKMINPSATIPKMATLRPGVRLCGTAPKSSKVTITDAGKLTSSYASYSSEKITFASGSGATVTDEHLEFATDTTEYLESEWLPQGVFFIDTREVSANNDGLDVLVIHGYDAMLKGEQDFSNQTLPDDVDISFVQRIASIMGVQIDQRTYDIMTSRYTVPMNIAYNLREFLGYIASMYAGCFVMTDEGKLRLVTIYGLPVETNLLVDTVGDVLIFGEDAILV